jgi:hypothetical protein
MQRQLERFGILAAFALVLTIPIPAHANHVLITEEEAKLPPPKGAVTADRRGITRAPRIDFISDGMQVHSPIHFRLSFQSFGGSKISPDSVKVTYLRTPNVDLTPRVKSFVQMTGIDIPDAELPVGDHMVRVDIKDSDGRSGSTSFVLKVTP